MTREIIIRSFDICEKKLPVVHLQRKDNLFPSQSVERQPDGSRLKSPASNSVQLLSIKRTAAQSIMARRKNALFNRLKADCYRTTVSITSWFFSAEQIFCSQINGWQSSKLCLSFRITTQTMRTTMTISLHPFLCFGIEIAFWVGWKCSTKEISLTFGTFERLSFVCKSITIIWYECASNRSDWLTNQNDAWHFS